MSNKEEEELIRISEIFETLRKDALEVTDLLVAGIKYRQLIVYVGIAFAIFSAWTLINSINSGDIFSIAMYGFFTIILFFAAPYGFYKNRQLKKKYEELVDIRKSLAEE